MSLIAAFLWTKSPKTSISTMILNDENIEILSQPKIHYFPKGYFQFRKASKGVITDFFNQIEHLRKYSNEPIKVEFKIVFHAHGLPYFFPAAESEFVSKVFKKSFKKTKLKIKNIEIKPQLRKRLSGKALKKFKKSLRSLYLVSRKKDRGFEYHLWAVAMHATTKTYSKKIHRIRTKLTNKIWEENTKI